MTKDDALKIALDYVLRTTYWTEGRDRHDTLKVIKEALAQPEQEPDWKDRLIAQQEETILWQAKRISEFLDQQKEQEPVLNGWRLRDVYFDADGEPSMHKAPKRKPLTHEQRVDLLAKFEAHKHEWHAPAILIDMVEAAHGIKE